MSTPFPLDAVFAATRDEGRAALVGYLPAGFPSVADSIRAAQVMVENGCDIVEVGLPYTDPLMDGPVIQSAATQALAGGVHTADVFRVARAVTDAGGAAVVMTYWNPVLRYGIRRFAEELKAAGGAGLITPDLVPDEADEWIAVADELGLAKIFLVAPSSTPARVAATTANCPSWASRVRARASATPRRVSSSGRRPPPTCPSASASASRRRNRRARSADTPTVSSSVPRSSRRCSTPTPNAAWRPSPRPRRN